MTPRRIFSRARAWAASIVLGVLMTLFTSSPAHAYPWMIRHGYTTCTPCHTDPSGAGPLTPYGRAQSELLLATQYGPPTEEPSKAAGFAWGEVAIPEQLRLGGDFREAYLVTKPEVGPAIREFFAMRADLFGDVKIGRFRAEGSIGYAPQGANAASITSNPSDNVVTRDHWVGYEIDEDASWLVRAGRIALPFGIRTVEHNLWARSLTRTDINDTQQYGASLAFTKERIRGEIMAIVGNFQLHPDTFRERGYSAFVEWAPRTDLAVGVSSLFTRARRDIHYLVTNYRQAHGGFIRYSPAPQIVLLAEADWSFQSLTWNGHRGGYAMFLQADYEPRQGVHFMLTGEAMNSGAEGEPPSYGGWASAVWFFMRHADIRMDNIIQRIGNASGDMSVYTMLFQLHVYL